MTFRMDTKAVRDQGVKIANDANNDLSNATPLVYSVIANQDSMPSLFTGPLTQFYQNLNDAFIKVFNQRYEMGQALQGAALASELNDLQIADSFKGPTSQGGLLPGAPS
jgi:hypothetical protein